MTSLADIKDKMFRQRWILKAERVSKNLILPGFQGLALYEVVVFFVRGLMRGLIIERAKSLSFSFFIALFPSVLFFFSIIPYIPIEGFQQTLMEALEGFLPPTTFEKAKGTIEEIVVSKNSGVLSLSFILALIFSTNGTTAMIESFNATYHDIETRSMVKVRLMATYFVFLISFILIVSMAAIIISSDLLQFLFDRGWIKDQITIWVVNISKYLIIVATVFFTVSVIYYYAPSRKQRFSFFSPGAIFATALFMITTLGFDFYVNNFSRYNALYGSIGTLIIFMLWVYFNSVILLLGFELNASISSIIRKRREENENGNSS
jgi:membrane protein